MSDLTIAILIAIPLVIGTIAILGYSLHQSEKRDVAKLLPKIKCVCGHSPLTWNGGVWLIDGPCHHPHDSVGHKHDDPDSDPIVGGAGYVFDCPRCNRSLSFTHDGRLHSAEEPDHEYAA